MPNNDIKAGLGGLLHGLGHMREVHKNLNRKLGPFELMEMGAIMAQKAFQIYEEGGGDHPGAGEYEPLLAAPMAMTEQRLYRIAQMAEPHEFERYCDDLANYGAAITDPVKRKRIGLFLVILGKAWGARDAGQTIAPPTSSYQQPGYGSQQSKSPQWQAAPQQAIEAPHPHENLFRQFIDAGARNGWQAMRAFISGMERERVRQFAQMLRDYASSLRNPEAIKTAIALSNNLALEFHSRFGNAQAALPAPRRS